MPAGRLRTSCGWFAVWRPSSFNAAMSAPNSDYPLVWIDADGIVCVDYGFNPTIDEAAVVRAHNRRKALCTERRPVMVIVEGVGCLSREAERYASSESVVALTIASALVVPNGLARMVAGLFLACNAPPYPCRVFESEVSARRWLAAFHRASPVENQT